SHLWTSQLQACQELWHAFHICSHRLSVLTRASVAAQKTIPGILSQCNIACDLLARISHDLFTVMSPCQDINPAPGTSSMLRTTPRRKPYRERSGLKSLNEHSQIVIRDE